MSSLAITLLLISAVLHTTWNLMLKQAGEKYMATWWAVLAGSVIFLPVLYFTGPPDREVWPLVLLSVVLELGYYAALSAAYTASDFSLVYPIARGAAPGLIAVWSVLLLGERLTSAGWLGLGLILAGLLIVSGSALSDRNGQRPSRRGILLAGLLAVLISCYSIVDGSAVKHTAALPYTIIIFFLMPVFSAPLMLKRYGWPTLKNEWLDHRLQLTIIGLLSVGAYFLVLAAYSISLISYSGAIREVSVVLGAFAGWKFLRERLGSLRLAGALVIFLGIVVIAVWG